MSGRTSIRAFGRTAEARFSALLCERVDTHGKMHFTGRLLQRWLSIYLNFIILTMQVILIMAAVSLSRQLDSQGAMIEASLAGLAVVYSLQLLGLSSYTMMLASMLENALTALERLLDLNQIEQEEKLNGSADPLAAVPAEKHTDWPLQGKIEFHNVNLKYREHLALALHGLTFTIDPGERVGIVGRSGAGKSSLVAALFRLFPISSGRILIDGIDVSKVPLKRLRSSISLITQDPVVFSGTLRYQVDPFQQYSDAEVWSALERSQLKQTLVANRGSADGLLEMECGAGGENLSNGERQLLCIARVLIKDTKILFCDEATRSVDSLTDEKIQGVIRDVFYARNTTILTIAHRLQTIVSSDKVIVMEKGKVAEMGTPDYLKAKEDGVFKSMLATLS